MFIDNSKTILITGASGGIGRKIAILFADKGWNILCHYNSSQDSIEDLNRYFVKNNIKCSFLKCDFSDKYQFNDFIEKINKFKIDSLVNNVGVSINSNKMEDIIRLFTINVFSAMVLTSKIFEKMKKNKFGRIVNISSIGAKYGSSVSSMSYGCSKLAIEGITKTFAREGAAYNVFVNTVRPGVIDTDFHKNSLKNMKERISLIPINRMGKAEDVAKIVYAIGSEENDFITNETIAISGGE